MRRIEAGALDLAAFIRPGDRVLCGQVSAEPQTLAAALPAALGAAGPFETFLGTVTSTSFDAAPAEMRFAGYGAMGRASRLARRRQLDVWPLHYGALEAGFASGRIRADVVLLQLAAGPGGLCATLANDYVLAAARQARCVIAEVSSRAPWCVGAEIAPGLPIPEFMQRLEREVETHSDMLLAEAGFGGR